MVTAVVTHSHDGTPVSPEKEGNSVHATTWLNSEAIVPSETNWSQKDKDSVILLIRGAYSRQVRRHGEERWLPAAGEGETGSY